MFAVAAAAAVASSPFLERRVFLVFVWRRGHRRGYQWHCPHRLGGEPRRVPNSYCDAFARRCCCLLCGGGRGDGACSYPSPADPFGYGIASFAFVVRGQRLDSSDTPNADCDGWWGKWERQRRRWVWWRQAASTYCWRRISSRSSSRSPRRRSSPPPPPLPHRALRCAAERGAGARAGGRVSLWDGASRL